MNDDFKKRGCNKTRMSWEASRAREGLKGRIFSFPKRVGGLRGTDDLSRSQGFSKPNSIKCQNIRHIYLPTYLFPYFLYNYFFPSFLPYVRLILPIINVILGAFVLNTNYSLTIFSFHTFLVETLSLFVDPWSLELLKIYHQIILAKSVYRPLERIKKTKVLNSTSSLNEIFRENYDSFKKLTYWIPLLSMRILPKREMKKQWMN